MSDVSGDDKYTPSTILSDGEFERWIKDEVLNTFFSERSLAKRSEHQTIDEWVEAFGQLLGEIQRGERDCE